MPFATLMALIEEAIATLVTNCAPLFGAKVVEVYIPALDPFELRTNP
jgi:hypothetical protein